MRTAPSTSRPAATTARPLPVLLALFATAACTAPMPRTVRCDVLSLPLEIDLGGLRPKTLEVRVHSGHVLIHSGETLDCDLRVDVFGVPVADESDVSGRLALSPLEDNEDVVRLSIEPPSGLPFDSVCAYYTLTVPADVALRVVSEQADVTLRGYAGDAFVHTASGRVRAVLAGGSCEIHNESGTTELRGDYVSASIESDSGPIDVTVPRDVEALDDLDLSSRSGELKLRADDHDDLELSFETRHGIVHSGLPVRWTREERTPGRVGFRSVGRLGRNAGGARVLARTDSSNLDLMHEPRQADALGADGDPGN